MDKKKSGRSHCTDAIVVSPTSESTADILTQHDIIEISNVPNLHYEFSIDELHTNLILLSNVKQGNKLIIQDNLLNIDTNFGQCITRWFNVIDRKKTMQFIKSIIEQTFCKIDEIINDSITVSNTAKNRDYNIQRFTTELKNSTVGLINLKITYETDELIKSVIDVILEDINNKISTNIGLMHYNTT